jgi:hypothetical protein
MIEIIMAIFIYIGGFLLAAICACFALRKATKRKAKIWLLIATAVLVFGQIALWQVIVFSGNGI